MILRDSIFVAAPIERCFDVSTRIDLVQVTLGFTPEPATGNVSAGSRVRWRGRMFGIMHEHHTLITAFEPPFLFRDSQERGRFAAFHHDHRFRETEGGTVMEDAVHFSLPWWMGGFIAERWLMARVIRRLLRSRLELLKHVAETGD